MIMLSTHHKEDIKQAAEKMSLVKRRAYQAKIANKYCEGNPRQTESIFGWNRQTVELGLHEQRTGLECFNTGLGGKKRWEEKHPDIAEALWKLAEDHAQQDPSFRTTLSYTRLTAAEALKQLQRQGYEEKDLPSPSSMAEILNRNGYRLRPVVKAKPKKSA